MCVCLCARIASSVAAATRLTSEEGEKLPSSLPLWVRGLFRQEIAPSPNPSLLRGNTDPCSTLRVVSPVPPRRNSSPSTGGLEYYHGSTGVFPR